jgi:shikimate dehydrogenase
MTDRDGMQVFGLLGNPVGHSLSPPMHEAAYRESNMNARYVTFEPDPEALESAVSGARALGIAGLNVTIPFKRAVLAACDPDDLAARIGAVNTLDFTSSGVDETDGVTKPTGHNTDALGARRALIESDTPLAGRAVVLGAGGAGRAIAFALADAGMELSIANRTTETAHALAEDLAGDTTEARGHGLDAVPALLDDATLLVNATSVGMESDDSPVPPEALHGALTVFDAVYRPLETRLLRDARAAGARTVDGATMLLHQGAAAFERWTGTDAPIDAMDATLRKRL